MSDDLSNESAAFKQSADGEGADWSAQLAQAVQDGNNQTVFMRQQVGQLFNAVNQLYGAVSAQCTQLRDSDNALLQELQKLQTGGPQRAMAGIYAKLFRDLIKPMNELDSLVAVAEKDEQTSSDDSWLLSLRIVRDLFEEVLRDWGCSPIEIRIGQDEFNPEIHEAIAADNAAERSSNNKITAVQRRGWMFGDTLLQFPQVRVD